jgi:hypothetical protein
LSTALFAIAVNAVTVFNMSGPGSQALEAAENEKRIGGNGRGPVTAHAEPSIPFAAAHRAPQPLPHAESPSAAAHSASSSAAGLFYDTVGGESSELAVPMTDHLGVRKAPNTLTSATVSGEGSNSRDPFTGWTENEMEAFIARSRQRMGEQQQQQQQQTQTSSVSGGAAGK